MHNYSESIRQIINNNCEKMTKQERKDLLIQHKETILAQTKEYCAKAKILRLKQEKLIANSFGFTKNINEVTEYIFKKAKNKDTITFENFVSELPNGVYHLGISSKPGGAHAMVYIKTEEGKHFIYDPNFAILAVNPSVSAARLYRMLKPYIKGESYNVSFSSYSLLPKNTSE